MWGLIVGVALGGLLLMVAVSSLRAGALTVGDRVFRRGEPRFAVAVGLMGSAGLLAAGSAVRAGMSAEEPAPETIDVPGFSLQVRGQWREQEGLAGAPVERDLGVVAYASPDGELVLTWRRAETEGSAEELLETLRQPELEYDRWEPTTVEGVPAVDMEYASPRGVVRARALAVAEGEGTLRWVLASCTHDGRGAPCEAAIASLRAGERLAAESPRR